MAMRGNCRLTGGGDGEDSHDQFAVSGDSKVRDDVVRVAPHLRKMITTKLAARALARRKGLLKEA